MAGKTRQIKNLKKNFEIASLPGQVIVLIIISSVLFFILWPVVSVLIKSIIIDGKVDFSCYADLFTRNRGLLVNSIFVACLSTILSVFFGTCIALYLTHTNHFGKKIVFGTLLVTMISPPFVSSLSYIMLFGKRGLITHNLLGLSLNPYGWQGIVIMQSVGYTTLCSLIIAGVIRGIDRNLEQASLDLGAGKIETLIKVTLPLAKPGLIVAALIACVKSLSDFGTPIIIGGGFNVLATESYLNVIGLYNLPMAASMSVLLLIPALLAFIYYRRQIRSSNFFSGKVNTNGSMTFRITGFLNLLIILVTWSFVLFEILKYSTIFWGAFARTWGFNYAFTLKHIKAVNFEKLGSIIRSLEYALIAGIIGTIIGLILSYLIGRKKIWGCEIFDFISTLPFMIPGTFFGIGYVIAFHDEPFALTGTGFIIVVNCIFRQLPIATKAGLAVLTQIDPELESSAQDLGAGRLSRIKDIIFPMMKPAFLVSFINTFTTTMTTIGAIIFLISPSSKVATVVMFDAIQNGNVGQGAVFANIIIVVVVFVNIGFSRLLLKHHGLRTG